MSGRSIQSHAHPTPYSVFLGHEGVDYSGVHGFGAQTGEKQFSFIQFTLGKFTV